ncbi:MAG: hypothetical protein JXA81_00630 [Sedimentisphaerales bacterium]|nr:hypothetical protein [Sedimentisphaerales bacterium]
MDKGENFVDTIYSRFVLRDALGKMVPGSILLVTIIGSSVPWPPKVDLIKTVPVSVWIGFFGLSWIVAFGLQSFGEKVKLIQYLPKCADLETWYNKYMQFRMKAKIEGVREHERMVVIMEAYGNAAIALGASFAFLLIKLLFDLIAGKATLSTLKTTLPCFGPPVIIFLVLMCCLYRMHREHRSRHYNLLLKGLVELNKDQAPKVTPPQ